MSPLLELERGKLDVTWKSSGDNRGLDAVVTLRDPVVRIAHQRETKSQKPLPATGEAARMAAPFPLEIDRVALHDLTVVFLDETVPGREILRLHEVAVLVENYGTQRADSSGLPTLVTARGRIGRDGHVSLFATVNPWSGELDFAGRAEIVGLRLEELAGFAEEQYDLRPSDGKISAFIEFSVQNGRITGGVKPILSGVELVPDDPGFFEDLEAWFAERAVELLSDDLARREALVGVVPFSGKVRDPHAAFWEGLMSVLGNAFIEAVKIGFGDVPP